MICETEDFLNVVNTERGGRSWSKDPPFGVTRLDGGRNADCHWIGSGRLRQFCSDRTGSLGRRGTDIHTDQRH